MQRLTTRSAPSVSSEVPHGRGARLPRLRHPGTATPRIPTCASRHRRRTWTVRTSRTGTSASYRRIRTTSMAMAMDRLRGVASPDRLPLLFRVLLDGGLAGVAWEDFDCLDVDHLEEAVPAQLASDAAVLHAAEGHPWIRLDDAVDEHHPGLHLSREFVGLTQVPRPEARAKAELGVVRLLDRGAQVRHRHHGGDRAERFLAEDAHVLRDVAEQGGLKVPALPTAALSADLDLRAFRDGVLHLALDFIPLRLADQRTHVGRRVERIAHPKPLHSLRELCDEFVGGGIDDEEAFGGDARLAAVDESSRDRAFRGRVQVRVTRHDERVRSAELEDDFLQILRGLAAHVSPCADGSRQAD